jgi:hypothetical protein
MFMSSITIEIVIGIVTFTMSVAASMFVAGTRWGRIETTILAISERLAKIEGMFTLTLRDKSDKEKG